MMSEGGYQAALLNAGWRSGLGFSGGGSDLAPDGESVNTGAALAPFNAFLVLQGHAPRVTRALPRRRCQTALAGVAAAGRAAPPPVHFPASHQHPLPPRLKPPRD